MPKKAYSSRNENCHYGNQIRDCQNGRQKISGIASKDSYTPLGLHAPTPRVVGRILVLLNPAAESMADFSISTNTHPPRVCCDGWDGGFSFCISAFIPLLALRSCL